MKQAEVIKIWEDRMTAFKASGQTVSVWCQAHQIVPHRLRYWLRKYSQKELLERESSPFVSLEIKEPSEPEIQSSLVVQVGPAFMEIKPGFDPLLLAHVVNALKALQ